MNLDLSVFIESEEEGIDGFSDLPIDEQMKLAMDSFPIEMIVNVKYPDDAMYKNYDKSIEERDYHVIGYVTYIQPGGYDRVVNLLLYPVDLEYKVMNTMNRDVASFHPSFIRHSKQWLRENNIKSLLD